MAYIAMACMVMAYIGMACTVMTSMVMAYTVIAIVTSMRGRSCGVDAHHFFFCPETHTAPSGRSTVTALSPRREAQRTAPRHAKLSPLMPCLGVADGVSVA